MAQRQKMKQNGRPGLEKGTLQKTLFTSVLTIAKEIPQKIKRKSFSKKTDSNRNNDTNILYIFTGNVKPYIQIHI